MRVWLAAAVAVGIAASAGSGRAQGIDCSRARSAPEKAICASPSLLALDHQVAVAYADALSRQPDRRDAMRQDLLAWLRARDAACNVPAAALERCLSGQLTTRLAALAPSAAAPPAPLAPTRAETAAPPPDPAIPAASFAQPAPAATLDAASLPAAAEADTVLHVTSPGRFTIAVHSPSGATLQLVDMLTGPSETAGAAGAQDGRLDKLLDVGAYKLRTNSAEGATGTVTLTVTPFHDAAPPAALPNPDRPLTATLTDGEQRAFWLLVPPAGGPNVRIEAAGRALADLRLWRDGRELSALDPAITTIEPVPGHTLTDARLVGHVEPGTYLAVAYGGPALAWTDNDGTQSFHLRAGLRDALAEGWAGGKVGPFGSELFRLPTFARRLRLDLPEPAAATLRSGDNAATVAKTSREPSAVLSVTPGRQEAAELRAAAGQAYTLRAVDDSIQAIWSRAGNWWVSAATTGMGGDELPPTLLLQRTEGPDKPPRILATTAPTVGAKAGYHARFNLRGPSSLLFQSPPGGEAAFASTGVDIRHGRRESSALPPGFFALDLIPQPGAAGSLEFTIGMAGSSAPPLAAPLPADPVIPFGLQTLEPGQRLLLSTGVAPGASAGLVVRAAPVPLVEGPLLATVAAGASLSVPVAIAPGGTLSVTELGVGPVAAGQTDNTQPGRATIVIPVADRARTIALAWHRSEAAPPPIPDPPPPGQVASVTAGAPRYMDLRRGEERGFQLIVPEGGLFRVETLGRLHTAGRLATPFIPRLASADGNGAGLNFLIQSALRAGRYRVDVTALGSAGHLGLLASPAPLQAGGTLTPGGTVRASLPAGTGVAFPLAVSGPADGRYRLDVLSLGAPWTGRLEDAEGWPMVAPGVLDGTEAALRPGQYRLVVTPDAVGRDVVARLTAITKPVEITGHGPHGLPFAQPQTAVWREPDGSDRPRAPDIWAFSLAGPAEVTLTLADGMVGDLRRAGVDDTLAKVVAKWTGPLAAGEYRLLASSVGRNDRLAYTVSLASPALQPGAPRSVTLPATLPFTLAEARVASLTSWGTIPVKAVLRQEGGVVVARFNSRADDWNIAASRLLPAGAYVLDLQSAAPPDMSGGSSSNSDSGDSSDDASDSDQAAQTAATQGGSAGATRTARTGAAADSSDDTDKPDATVEVRLTLPPALPPAPAPATTTQLDGVGVHVLSLPAPEPGSLLIAAADAAAPVVLALERDAAGGWQTVALATGRRPVVAAPADGEPASWRVETWAIDGGSEPIRLAARALAAPAQPGPASLAAVDGFPAPLAVARASVAEPGLLTLGTVLPGMLAGGWPGHALHPARSAEPTPGRDLWLLAAQPGAVTVTPATYAPGQESTVQLPPGLPLTLPAAPDGTLAVWRVASQSGQAEMGLAASIGVGDMVALASAPLTVRGTDRPAITRFEPKLLPAVVATNAVRTAVPPNAALPFTLPAGDKALHLDLGPGLAVFAGWHDAAPFAVYAGSFRMTETLQGAWTDLLVVNTGTDASPATILTEAAPVAETLRPGMVRKRFFGNAGSFAFAFDAPAGSRLVTAGVVVAKAIVTGAIVTGAGLSEGDVSGPGRAWIEHGVGPVAVWLEAPGTSPWPAAAPQDVALPARTALAGAAAAFRFVADGPALLHVSTTAPALAGLQQAGRTDPPAMFAAGAELHRVVAPGPVTLLLVSPDEGPLSGTLSVWAEALRPLGEGLGETVAVGPGGSAAFGFTLPAPRTIGIGVRADPDVASVRLLDARGAVLGEGVAQLVKLPAGDYVLEALVPGRNPATLRPALVGLTPPGHGPPPDIVQSYLELAGMKPQKAP